MFLDFDLENLWFGYRQRHIPAGGDHVKLAWKQHHEPTRVANTTGDAAGVIARTPVEIGSRWPDVEGRLPRGIGIANLRDAPDEWSLQFERLGLAQP
jgi:hypothetical protein